MNKEQEKLTALIQAKEKVLLNKMELLANLYQQAVVKNEEISGRKGGFYCEECWKSKFEYRYYEKSGKKNNGGSGFFILLGVVVVLILVIFFLVVWWLTRE